MKAYLEQILPVALNIGTKILGALVLWIVGRLVISMVVKMIDHAMKKQDLDATLRRYMSSSSRVLLNVVLVIAVLSVFGVETTTFAGLLAAAGVAIGMAWSGLLSNFAAGLFMIVLRPMKSGDFVSAGGVVGTVDEIGLFVTSINTPDNVKTFVGNGKIFSDTIQNFSANEFRRVDLTAQLTHDVDPAEAIELLRKHIESIDNVCDSPAPDIEILEFNPMGPVLAVRPYCHTDHYWQVYFDTNKGIRNKFAAAGYAPPRQYHVLMDKPAA
jgi:small conductance mechanosensitive channel